MCSHYQGIQGRERFERHFGMALPEDTGQADVWPGYRALFIRNTAPSAAPGTGRLQALTGLFGLVPQWSTDLRMTRSTYNARSETASEKPSFRDAWRRGQHCIVPAEALFEPDWRSGRPVAARIGSADGAPLGVAGLWSCWRAQEQEIFSFTMLTVNAEDHPVMREMHKPGDEKRMVVVVAPALYAHWLSLPARESLGFLQSQTGAALAQLA
jgi:putative SOS response-associated peptidase YedK